MVISGDIRDQDVGQQSDDLGMTYPENLKQSLSNAEEHRPVEIGHLVVILLVGK